MQLSAPSRTVIFMLALFVAATLSSIPFYAADQSEYTIRASADEVWLAFAASDRQGHVIKSLSPTDIAVADNGLIIRHFRSFRVASESPLDLVILLDASGSVASQISNEIAAVEHFVARSPWGERDRISILSFGGFQPQLICARNCNETTASAQLSALRANGLTPLYDALMQASDMLRETRDSESRQAMILFSDGIDTISMHSLSEVLEAAQNLQSAIYSVNSRSAKTAPSKGDEVLNYLAGSTGGLSFQPGQNVAAVLPTILDDLHSGYVLTYDLPERSTGQHSVRVSPIRDPQLQFRSRMAYNDGANE